MTSNGLLSLGAMRCRAVLQYRLESRYGYGVLRAQLAAGYQTPKETALLVGFGANASQSCEFSPPRCDPAVLLRTTSHVQYHTVQCST